MKNFAEFVVAHKKKIYEQAEKTLSATLKDTPSFHTMIRGFMKTNGTN